MEIQKLRRTRIMNLEKTKVVATRVTLKTAELIAEFCKRDAHVNTADFIRDAIRDKLWREAPELYHQLLQGGMSQ